MSDIGRVLHVIATLDRGGTEVSCLGLTRALHGLGIENHLTAIHVGGRGIVPAFEGLVPEVSALPSGRRARMQAFGQMLRRLRPDAVIFHFFTIEHVLLAFVARRAGVRRIAIKQGNPASGDPGVRRKSRLILAATRWLGGALVCSSRYIESTMSALGRLPKGSCVVHNGCDTAAIRARAEAVPEDPEEAVILMVARLDPIKDHAALIRALACMPESVGGRRVMLDLAGEGVLRPDLEALAAEQSVADRVRFLGARSDIPELLGRASVFCLSTTREEGFGVVLIEALAAEVPVVASDVPACAEVLEGGTLGCLVAPGDPGALARALETALAPGKARPPLEEVAQRYDMAAMARGYLGVLSGT